METATANEQLLVERKPYNGEDKTYTPEGKRSWISSGRISWGAIFSGALVTTISQMLLSLLGTGIGLSTIDPLREQDPMRGLGAGTIIWWSVTMLISLFLGGLTTGRMYQSNSKMYLTWHGLLTWCVFTLFSFFMLTTSVGMLVSGAGNVIGTAVSAGASAAKPLDISSITGNANSLMGQPTNNNNSNAEMSNQNNRTNARNNLNLVDQVSIFFQGKNVENPASRRELAQTLSAQTGMTEVEANNKVDSWIRSYEELKGQAKIKADQAARAASMGSIVGFFALLIGALVTIWGARSAALKENTPANKTEKITMQ